MKKEKQFDLEDRLVDFAVLVLDLAENLPKGYGPNHLSKQITRSGTAPALLYGEAQAAESKADFIHKMKIALKELRETFICLKIIYKKKYLTAQDIKNIADENSQLIAIFAQSIKTAEQKVKV